MALFVVGMKHPDYFYNVYLLSITDKCNILDYDLTGFGHAAFDVALFLKFSSAGNSYSFPFNIAYNES